jgi:transketolase
MTQMTSRSKLEALIAENSISILRKCNDVSAGHIGGSLSLSSFLLPLLYLLKLNDELHNLELVLSKGHASLGLYSILNTLNINNNPFQKYCDLKPNSFHGHTCKHADNLIVHSTGSLGHGLPFAYGRAIGQKLLSDSPKNILCILGDGELQEGTFYETYLHFSRTSDINLKIIIDDNNSIETETKTCSEILHSLLPDRLYSVDCSDYDQCCRLIDIVRTPGLQLVHCKTSKYVGLPIAFHDPRWHAGVPSAQELDLMITGLLPAFQQ